MAKVLMSALYSTMYKEREGVVPEGRDAGIPRFEVNWSESIYLTAHIDSASFGNARQTGRNKMEFNAFFSLIEKAGLDHTLSMPSLISLPSLRTAPRVGEM